MRALAGGAVLALALFHVRLFWQRLSDQSVLEPVVAAKWLVTALVLYGLWRLKAGGHRLLAGRRAGVFWLVALLLHVQLPVAPAAELTESAELGWLFALPATVSLGAAVALALGLGLAAWARAVERPPHAGVAVSTHRLGKPVAGSLLALASRPPPLLS